MTTEVVTKKTSNAIGEKIIKSLPNIFQGIKELFINAIVQVRIYHKVYAGIMHGLIFGGVTIQVIGTVINLMQMALFIPFVELPFPRGNGYLAYELIMDLAGVAILIGVSMAFFRRYVLHPKTLETKWDDTYALIILTLIPIAGFTTEALRIISTSPPWSNWSPIGNLWANTLRGAGVTPISASAFHLSMVIIHAVLGLTLVASIPFTKLRHLVFTPLNILFRPKKKTGELFKIENIEETEILGVGEINQFQSTQLLSLEACLRCGRCEEACPASISGMPYSPKTLIQNLRDAMVSGLVTKNGNGDGEIFGTFIDEHTPWHCTTCGACIKECPAFVNPVDEVIDLRRYQVLTTGAVEKSVSEVMKNLERQGNPWGMPASDRTAWAEGLNIRELSPGEETDTLVFMGCALAYDDRNKKVAHSFIHILQSAGIDFATLGMEETCCGETARRMGHEYLFQVFAQQNINAFNQVKFNRIVTQCPHCFNTLKNEYPQFGGNYQVQHYTEYLNELNNSWKGKDKQGINNLGQVTYHDSCYLGRYNNVYSEPRALLKDSQIPLVEMARTKEKSFCCGGGGGQMWMETDAETRINHRRLADALAVNADVVTTACPYCLIMFDDAIRSKGLSEKIQVMDIAEVLEKQLTS